MANKSVDQADPRTLAALLAPADEAHLWSDADMAALLRHQLDSPFPLSAGNSAPATIGQLLTVANPSLDSLRRLKEFAKSARQDERSGIPPQISSALYYSAIFAALTRLETRLSQLDSPALLQGAEFLLSQPWLDSRLRTILEAGTAQLRSNH